MVSGRSPASGWRGTSMTDKVREIEPSARPDAAGRADPEADGTSRLVLPAAATWAERPDVLGLLERVARMTPAEAKAMEHEAGWRWWSITPAVGHDRRRRPGPGRRARPRNAGRRDAVAALDAGVHRALRSAGGAQGAGPARRLRHGGRPRGPRARPRRRGDVRAAHRTVARGDAPLSAPRGPRRGGPARARRGGRRAAPTTAPRARRRVRRDRSSSSLSPSRRRASGRRRATWTSRRRGSPPASRRGSRPPPAAPTRSGTAAGTG